MRVASRQPWFLGLPPSRIGTGFLRCPEAKLPKAWADAMGHTLPEQTLLTRAFSGRLGRSIATEYAHVAQRSPAGTISGAARTDASHARCGHQE
jgi:NAD(P)H-dependent flavin oxidoreductase YrpB (nitropropane dioxygenase family)